MKICNERFSNALEHIPQKTPPIWFMRQAGRYHSHYQNLKRNYTFEELCKNPDLAAETALGPINDFDFDVAILFSDILFVLEALGMSLKYDPGPIFGNFIDENNYEELQSPENAIKEMSFQENALLATRDLLPDHKSLIGFVGGPWTVLSYGLGLNKGIQYENNYSNSFVFKVLSEKIIPLIKYNISLQLNAGAEVVMIFDTDAKSISDSENFNNYSKYLYKEVIKEFPKKIGYYSKSPFDNKFFVDELNSDDCLLAGLGVDHQLSMDHWFKEINNGFIQGNFNQESMVKDHDEFKRDFDIYVDHIQSINEKDRAGWVCGLGHGILKDTPEENVHYFIETIRKIFS